MKKNQLSVNGRVRLNKAGDPLNGIYGTVMPDPADKDKPYTEGDFVHVDFETLPPATRRQKIHINNLDPA